jgi:hypothetical protein
MDLDTLAQSNTVRRLLVSMVLILALGYLLTHTFEYACVFLDNQNSPTQGCLSGADQKEYLFSLWVISLIGYLIYELLQVLKIEIVDETKKG